MTTITIKYKDNFIVGFTAKGHTGYAQIGQDILCSSLSSIMQTAVLGLKKVAKLKINYVTNAKTGYINCSVLSDNLPQNLEIGQIILNTMVCGVKDVASGFKNYVKVEEIRDVY